MSRDNQFEFETMIRISNARCEADIYRKKGIASYDSIERINSIVDRVMDKTKKGQKI